MLVSLQLSGVLVALLLGHAPELRTPPPGPGNVLILIADDLGIDQLALYGVAPDPAPTPNLDLMAATGVLFRNAWSQPTCSPTRATIQTGRYAFRTSIGAVVNAFGNGPALPFDEVTLPEMLDLGTGGLYSHAAIGKWHLGSSQVGGDLAPNLAGYGYFAGSMEGQITHYSSWRRVVNGAAATSTRYATTACVNDALAWIAGQSEPWMCVVSFQAPHAPFHRPPARLHSQTLGWEEPRALCGDPGADPRPFYKATVEALDREIGRLFRQFPPGELSNTTVFFLGDNGTDPCIAQAPFSPNNKGTLYEGGVCVPLLVAGRGVMHGGQCDALVNTSDLFATVAELAGVDLAATLPGVTLDSVSFAPCLANPSLSVRQWVFAESFLQNGAGNPEPQPPCPPTGVCQTSLGFDGPGTSTLASCGPPLYGLYGAHVARWQLTNAPPHAPAMLVVGPYQPAWVPSVGAWLVSRTPDYLLSYYTSSTGTFEGELWTADTSLERHYQVIVRDLSRPRGYSVTNALRMDFLPMHMRAVRGPRFKLIRLDPCQEELYDLVGDPFEHSNLLAGPLDADALAAYGQLSQVLDTLN